MMTVYLNIGSNKGNRKAHIERAIALIASHYPQARIRRSEYIESQPWGYESDNVFTNIGIALDFDHIPDPLDLLHDLQRIERRISHTAHRNADGSYRDRDIDIDIIMIDGMVIDTPELKVPHPRAHLREFVMRPLIQLGGSLPPMTTHDNP